MYEHRARLCLRLLVEVDPVIEVDLKLHVIGSGNNSLGRESGYARGWKRRRHGVHRRYEELIELVVG